MPCCYEGSPFGDLQRREYRRQIGQEYRACPAVEYDARVMYRVPHDPVLSSWQEAIDALDADLIRASRCVDPPSQLDALVRVAATAQRAAEQLALIGREP